MKIGFFSTSSDPIAGWGNLTIEIANYFYSKNVDFFLYVPAQEIIPENTPWKDKFRPILPRKCVDYFSKDFLKILFFDLNKIEEVDVVYSLDCMSISYLCYRLAKKRNLTFIQGIQGTYGVLFFSNVIKRYFHKKVLMSCHGIISPSRFSITLMQNFFNNYDILSKSKVIHNGVNFKRFYRPISDENIKQRFTKKPLEFIAIGGLKIRKGLDVSIMAIAEVKKKYPDVILKIVGPGDKQELLQVAKKFNVDRNIVFCGSKLGSELVDELHNSFSYVHSPRMFQWNFEGFGIVYLEANACGLPAIGTYSAGVTDAVIHRENGLLAQEDDPIDLANQMIKLIEDEKLYRDLSLCGISRAKHHDWEIIGQTYLEFFNLIIKCKLEGRSPNQKRYYSTNAL